MPEMHYTVRWPDDRETACYSPSLVVREVLEAGQDYAITDFMDRVRRATAIANERVHAKYGFFCSRANDQLAELEGREREFAGSNARVRVVSFDPA
ncbi:MAG: MSMEG_0570 family nitrogen starvation response protein [Piscinibacter sp.]|nr:MSMEG_0570 family nitrogen starvation response protein [Piscinibacter sp.]